MQVIRAVATRLEGMGGVGNARHSETTSTDAAPVVVLWEDRLRGGWLWYLAQRLRPVLSVTGMVVGGAACWHVCCTGQHLGHLVGG